MADIFVSYASKNRDSAKILVNALAIEGWSIWWDSKVPLGRRFDTVIASELANARCVIVLWSVDSIISHWVLEEATDARERSILLPVLIEAIRPPIGFRAIQAASLAGWKGDVGDPSFRQLTEAVASMIGPAPNKLGNVLPVRELLDVFELPPQNIEASAATSVTKLEDDTTVATKICMIGVGGCGGNIVNNLIRSQLPGCSFVACNTDAQALELSAATHKIQLGLGVARGLGTGGRPDVGRAAAEESLNDISEVLRDTEIVFIAAGMGGGTGTGASPVIARAAHDNADRVVIAVVAAPFHFEGVHRAKTAQHGLEELAKYANAVIVMPNQNLFLVANERSTFADVFALTNGVIRTIYEAIVYFFLKSREARNAFCRILQDAHDTVIRTTIADEHDAIVAMDSALSNPLLGDASIKGAKSVLVMVVTGADVTIDEGIIRGWIAQRAGEASDIVVHLGVDEQIGDRLQVLIVATGFETTPSLWLPINTIEAERSLERPAPTVTNRDDSPVGPRLAKPKRSGLFSYIFGRQK